MLYFQCKANFCCPIKQQKFFLEQLCAKINEFYQLYRDLVAKPFKQFDDSTELFDFIYDTGSHANRINEYLLQSSFNKVLFFDPRSFCKKKFHYDALALADAYKELHRNLHQIDILYPSKKEIIGSFSTVEKELRQLRTAAYQEIEEIDIRLAALNRSIF